MATGYTVSPSFQAGSVGIASGLFTVASIGGAFNPAGNGQTITATSSNSSDNVNAGGSGATTIGPSTGPIVTFQPNINGAIFTFAINPSSAGIRSISFTNNQGWSNPSAVDLIVGDIFTTVSQAITTALNQAPIFTALVKTNNLIDMTSSQFAKLNQFKAEVQPGDLPEVILLQTNWGFAPFASHNSRTSDFAQTYALIMTLDKLASIPLNKLKVAACAALMNAGGSPRGDLSLPGLVRGFNIPMGADDGLNDKRFKRGRIRWLSTMVIHVEFYMNAVQLAALSQVPLA
jgi:hypothetical protein